MSLGENEQAYYLGESLRLNQTMVKVGLETNHPIRPRFETLTDKLKRTIMYVGNTTQKEKFQQKYQNIFSLRKKDITFFSSGAKVLYVINHI